MVQQKKEDAMLNNLCCSDCEAAWSSSGQQDAVQMLLYDWPHSLPPSVVNKQTGRQHSDVLALAVTHNRKLFNAGVQIWQKAAAEHYLEKMEENFREKK